MGQLLVWGVFDQGGEFWVAKEYEIRPGEYKPTGGIITAVTREELHASLTARGLERSHALRTEPWAALKEVWRPV
jgi:hypothetical protein